MWKMIVYFPPSHIVVLSKSHVIPNQNFNLPIFFQSKQVQSKDIEITNFDLFMTRLE